MMHGAPQDLVWLAIIPAIVLCVLAAGIMAVLL